MSDDSKKLILLRRARFVAAALAGVAAASSEACGGRVLEPDPRTDAGDDAEPRLSLGDVPDTSAPPSDTTRPSDPDASVPVPCLRIAIPREGGR